jgi:hypothetical protein
MVEIPKWQRNMHFVTEVAALLFLPWLYQAAKASSEPHKTRLWLLFFGTILVDGFLAVRWLTKK